MVNSQRKHILHHKLKASGFGGWYRNVGLQFFQAAPATSFSDASPLGKSLSDVTIPIVQPLSQWVKV